MGGEGRLEGSYSPVAVIYENSARHSARPAIISDLQTNFFRAAFAAWVLLPLGIVAWEWAAPSWRASCEKGFSNFSLVLLIMVGLHHLYSESCAYTALTSLLSQPEMVIMRHFGVVRRRKYLVAVGMCEAFLLFTDVTFPFVARECDDILTENWKTAWRDVPMVGDFAVKMVEKLRFWGFALLCSATGILVNGVLGLLCMPFWRSKDSVSGTDFVAWARVALLAEEMANQKRYVVDYKDNPAARKARSDFIYGRLDADTATMFEDFNQKLADHLHLVESFHFLTLLLLKIFVGRCLQLWIQASFLAMAFHSEGAGAKDKVVVSCIVSALILLHRAAHGVKALGCTGLPVLILIIGFLIWSGAKALAFTLWKKSQFKESIKLFHEIEDLIGSSAALCENMGHTYSSMGNYDEAAKYFQRALRCLDQEVGKKTGDRAGILLGLGLIEDRLGHFEEALAAVRESQDLFRQRANGKPSSLVAKAGMSIAKILLKLALQETDELKKQQMEDEAIEREQENVALFEVTCGEDSPLTASALRGLGEALKRRGKTEEAIASFARSYNLEAQKDAFDLLSIMEARRNLLKEYHGLLKCNCLLTNTLSKQCSAFCKQYYVCSTDNSIES
eukprot:s1485_g6.t4